MKFAKPALSTELQADLLISRGMQGDRGEMVQRLGAVNYYRLSGYWHIYRDPNNQFRPGTTIDSIWGLYVFDRKLRLLAMDALERIEVAVRTRIAYEQAHMFGPFGYARNSAALSSAAAADRVKVLEQISEEVQRSGKEPFVKHFFDKYDGPDLPIWMVAEVLSFGSVVRLLRGSHQAIQGRVADFFRVPAPVFVSWMRTLNFVRNVCAHHGRLWNRELSYQPMIPRANKYPDWHTPVSIDSSRVFSALSICRHCLRIVAVGSTWGQRVRALLAEHPQVPRRSMGFPDGWEGSPIWQEASSGK